MKYLTIFLWNDSSDEIAAWRRNLEDAQIPARQISYSTTGGVDEIVREIRERCPDFVVLDLNNAAKGKEDKTGVRVCRLIREFDKLVPIVVITAFSRLLVEDGEFVSESGFDAVFESAAGRSATFFKENVVEGTRIQSALLRPDFALVREVVTGLRRIRMEANDAAGCLVGVENGLVELPLLGGYEKWYARVAALVLDMGETLGLNDFCSRFRTASEVFRKSDPFYMAGSGSRKHLNHNVLVFLLGLSVVVGSRRIRDLVLNDFVEICKGREDLRLQYGILVWAGIGLTHDLGYLGQAIRDVLGELVGSLKLYDRFGPGRFEVVVSELDRVVSGIEGGMNHHKDLGADFWSAVNPGGVEGFLMQRVSEGIRRHDSSGVCDKVNVVEWYNFLAVMCDELQDWGRVRNESVPEPDLRWGDPLRLFLLDKICVLDRDSYTSIDLHFCAVYHHSAVLGEFGKLGREKIKERFGEILDRIVKNVSSGFAIVISLSVKFSDRSVNPVVVSRRIDGEILSS